MRALTGQDILQVWETGLAQHPLERALTLLAAGLPECSRHELAALPIGQRDGYLLTLREQTWGPHLSGQAVCPSCKDQVEFAFQASDIRVLPEAAPNVDTWQLSVDGCQLSFRLPTSLDLAAIAPAPDVEQGRRQLAARCIVEATQSGAAASGAALPELVIAALAEQIALRDPQADVEFELCCPACEHHWQAVFDVVTFFWTEISTQARRLLHEVHMLAQAYGWSEADVLALSPARRRFYLEMVD